MTRNQIITAAADLKKLEDHHDFEGKHRQITSDLDAALYCFGRGFKTRSGRYAKTLASAIETWQAAMPHRVSSDEPRR